MEEVPCCLDFGVTKAGTLIMAMDMYGEFTVEVWKIMLSEMFEDEAELAAMAQQMYDATHGKYINALPYDIAYEVVLADSKSGKVVLTISAEEGEDRQEQLLFRFLLLFHLSDFVTFVIHDPSHSVVYKCSRLAPDETECALQHLLRRFLQLVLPLLAVLRT